MCLSCFCISVINYIAIVNPLIARKSISENINLLSDKWLQNIDKHCVRGLNSKHQIRIVAVSHDSCTYCTTVYHTVYLWFALWSLFVYSVLFLFLFRLQSQQILS